jgi:DNA-binding response OmpR family regulator
MPRSVVLIIDDDPNLRELMAETLKLEGFDPQVAMNGLHALERLQHIEPRAIVLDLLMPVMDGWGFRDAQRLIPIVADIPVIVVSAAPADQMRGLDAAAILPKPVDFNRLVDVLRVHCGE